MTLTKLIKGLPFGITAGVAGLALVACGSGTQGSTTTAAVADVPAQLMSFQVVGPEEATVLGPDGAKHDVFFSISSTTVKVGVPVTITIENKDTSQHSMTAPELGINILVAAATEKGATTTTYTFTPKKAGSFRWFCAIPCDSDNAGWDMTSDGTGMGQNNFMAGFITVTN